MNRYPSILKLVGKTPIVKLRKLSENSSADIYVKLEYLNPTGSHKDRIALYMIRDAEERGLIKPGDMLVEASSGNTAISVAWISVLLGYRATIFMEEDVSPVKVKFVEAFGAKVVKVPGSSQKSCEEYAEEYAEKNGFFYLNQSANEANVRAHYESTGPEIYDQLNGRIDVFVMGIGTGGTISGVGKYLKEKTRGRARIVAVLPRSPPTSGEADALNKIEGLTFRIIPEIWKKYSHLADEVVEVSYEDALRVTKKLIRLEGILGGISTGANVYAALKAAEEMRRGVIATIAPDNVLRYPQLLE